MRDYFRRAKGLAKRKSYVELIESSLSAGVAGKLHIVLGVIAM